MNISAPGSQGDWIKEANQMNFAIRVRDLSPPKCFTLTVGFKRFDRIHLSKLTRGISVLNKTPSTVRTLLNLVEGSFWQNWEVLCFPWRVACGRAGSSGDGLAPALKVTLGNPATQSPDLPELEARAQPLFCPRPQFPLHYPALPFKAAISQADTLPVSPRFVPLVPKCLP